MGRLHSALLALVLLALVLGAHAVEETDSPEVNSGKSTDTAGSEGEAISSSASAARAKARKGAENFTFQAEVTRLMDILINSLYSNKDIFLRELISNASDALDKIRFLALTDKSVLGEGDVANLEIKIWLDKDNNVLYLRDRGIGMTKDDLIKNLGTIAKSGTSAFLESMQKGGDVNLIGQFGVGFYSVYLVADWVEVVTKHNDDAQWVWSSGADGSFTVAQDDFSENEELGRGTLLKIHLKDEAQEYAQTDKLKELVAKYSEFINFPIYLLTTKEVDVPVDDDEADADEAAADDDKKEDKEEADTDKEKEEEDKEETKDEDDDVEDEEDEEEEDKDKPKEPKTRKEKRDEWDLLNDNKAIWLRAASDISDEEYQKFYKAVSKDYGDALTWTHFRAEGDVEFKSILYIPKTAPFDFYDKYYEKGKAGLKLYVRRVFISDDFADLLPRFLAFLRGLVDSDTLPLNVSREMLQAHSSLKTIKKKLVRKALDLIKRLADDENKCKEDKKEDEEEDEEAKDKDKPKEACTGYTTFWGQFGKSIKLGVIDDSTNRNRMARLLRFHSSKSTDKLTSLEDYVSRMKEGQKFIYFLSGASQAEVEKSPMLEQLVHKDYEVLFLTDVLDEYVMQHLPEFEDKKFADASKEDLKLDDKDDKAKEKEQKEQYKDLTAWWKTTLGDKVTSVKVSNRLATTPCVVVAGKYGQNANMERIMKAQAFSDPQRQAFAKSQRALEINPSHPLISALRDSVAADNTSSDAASLGRLLFETALMESGFQPDDIKSFSRRVYTLASEKLGVKLPEVAEEPKQEAKGGEEDIPRVEL